MNYSEIINQFDIFKLSHYFNIFIWGLLLLIMDTIKKPIVAISIAIAYFLACKGSPPLQQHQFLPHMAKTYEEVGQSIPNQAKLDVLYNPLPSFLAFRRCGINLLEEEEEDEDSAKN